jgi:hypothetical protein
LTGQARVQKTREEKIDGLNFTVLDVMLCPGRRRRRAEIYRQFSKLSVYPIIADLSFSYVARNYLFLMAIKKATQRILWGINTRYGLYHLLPFYFKERCNEKTVDFSVHGNRGCFQRLFAKSD